MTRKSLSLAAAVGLAAIISSGCSTESGSENATATENPQACNRECLEGFIDLYLRALVARDPARLPLAANVRLVENNQILEIGQGTWRTVTGLGTYRHYFSDVAAGQAAMIGIVEENGTKIIYDLRLAIDDGEITEIEVMIPRAANAALLYEEHGVPHQKFLETIPPQQRLSREELVAVADKYLSGMEHNDPNGDYSFFHDECDRWEHAERTTNNDPEAYGHSSDTVFVTLNCREQFQTGFLGFVTRIRDRRYVIIDEQRQTVFAFATLDHDGTIREIPLSDGRTFVVPPYFSSPRTLQVGEAWRIEDGKLRQIEMTLTELPYGTRPGFESGDDWFERDVAATASATSASIESSLACDRVCLEGFVERFLVALIAHDPTQLTTAPNLKYTENGQQLNPGDGLWGTATALGDYAISAADPASGTVGFVGTIVETDVPSLLALRLTVDTQQLTEIEAVVFREEAVGERGGTLTLFAPRMPNPFDPTGFAQLAPALTSATPTNLSATQLSDIAASYYTGLELADASRAALADNCARRENGVMATGVADAAAPDTNYPDFRPAALGCAAQLDSNYLSYFERIRDRRSFVADPSTGLVLDLAFLDVPNDKPSVEVAGVGAVALPFASTGPYTMMMTQLYKIRDGKIVHIEAATRPVPYGAGSGW